MDCCRDRETIFQFVDNELERERVLELESHCTCCTDCARRRDYTVRLVTIIRTRITRYSAPEALRRRIFARLASP